MISVAGEGEGGRVGKAQVEQEAGAAAAGLAAANLSKPFVCFIVLTSEIIS